MIVRIAPQARADLGRLSDLLAAIDGDLADAALNEIADRIQLLVDHPAIGSPISRNRRKLVARRFNHVIFYRVVGQTITISRIRHAREDWR